MLSLLSIKGFGESLDRYIFELQQNIAKVRSGINLILLHQGFFKEFCRRLASSFTFITDLLFTKAEVYHAISPIGGP